MPPWIKAPKKLHFDIPLDEGGLLPVSFTYGYIKKSKTSFYKTSIVQSRVALSINGRILKDNAINEIWGIKAHQRYNSFRGILNIELHNSDLKIVTTEKRNLVLSNKYINRMFSEIRKLLPVIQPLKKN